jgi:hypothetical protein
MLLLEAYYMATQFVVKEAEDGYDVYARELISHGEYRARYNHLVGECEFTPEQAARELYEMVAKFWRKTEAPVPLSLCEQYVFDYVDPGDIVIFNGTYFIVNKPAAA